MKEIIRLNAKPDTHYYDIALQTCNICKAKHINDIALQTCSICKAKKKTSKTY